MATYHPSRSERRAVGAEGNLSPKASMPASTPVTIDATAAHVDTMIALPCFKPLVYLMGIIQLYYQDGCLCNNCLIATKERLQLMQLYFFFISKKRKEKKKEHKNGYCMSDATQVTNNMGTILILIYNNSD